ncbi:MAG: outer membrane beta-barrel protein [Thiothrix sp.]|uniref:outer membrane beta-barrel protein n=1 Tax=Thiothrix sp. TaxID=1032 RepID=UPI00262F55ED|nr:outer membrane beta-barrel protein [Thiothrix sp.]MDD5394570.1 outer membrane beta-barrel protein [Thiothrix sp.]
MKTYLSCTFAGVALWASAAHAGGGMEGFGVPSNMDFYAGGSVGTASQDGACNTLSGSTGCTDSGTGYKVFAGAQLKPNAPDGTLPKLGVEGGYIKFGESSSAGELLSVRGIPIGSSSAKSDLTGIYAAGTVSMPVAPRVEILGKAGVMHWSQENKSTAVIDDDPEDERNQSTSSSESGFGGLLGAGAQYKINDNFSVRGEYERGFGVGKGASKTEPSLLSVGAVFSTL